MSGGGTGLCLRHERKLAERTPKLGKWKHAGNGLCVLQSWPLTHLRSATPSPAPSPRAERQRGEQDAHPPPVRLRARRGTPRARSVPFFLRRRPTVCRSTLRAGARVLVDVVRKHTHLGVQVTELSRRGVAVIVGDALDADVLLLVAQRGVPGAQDVFSAEHASHAPDDVQAG